MIQVLDNAVKASKAANEQLENVLPVACSPAVAEYLEADIGVLQQIKDAIENDMPSTLVLDMVNGVTAVKEHALEAVSTQCPTGECNKAE